MNLPQQPKPPYRTTNLKQYNAELKARGFLTVWLDKGMSWFAAASAKRRRSPKFADAAIQYSLSIKNLFRLALQQATGFVQSLLVWVELARAGLQHVVPHAAQSRFAGEHASDGVLLRGRKLSMDGREACSNNIFVEHVWRCVKSEARVPQGL